MYERDSLARDTTVKEKSIDYSQDNMKFRIFPRRRSGSLSEYFLLSVPREFSENQWTESTRFLMRSIVITFVLDDYVIPTVFHALFDITSELKTEDKELVLLRELKGCGY